jgi:outer membrane protein assembly factor BamB
MRSRAAATPCVCARTSATPGADYRGIGLAFCLLGVGGRDRAALPCALFIWTASVAPGAAWVRTLDGSRVSADGISLAAATPDGDLVTVGCPQGIVRLDGGTGRPRWQRDALPLSTGCRSAPSGGAVTTRSDGTILLARGAGVAALDGQSGDMAWSHDIEGSTDEDPALLSAIAVDPAGDVVVAGELDQGGDEDTTNENFLVEKLTHADGHLLWRVLLDGSPRSQPPDCDGGCDPPGYPTDYALAVTIRNDIVIAAGAIERADHPHFAVVAIDGASGVERWRWESPEPGEALAIAFDRDGMIVAGHGPSGPLLVALDADGTLRWQTSVAGGDADTWRTLSIADDVVVAGRTSGHATVASYSPAGAPRWSYDEPDAGAGVALGRDPSGVTALIALDAVSNGSLGRWRMRAFDEAGGAVRWVVDPADGRPVALASAGGEAFVAGTSETVATFRDGTAMAFDVASGTMRWRRDFDTPARSEGRAEAVAVAPGGDVVAAGFIANADTAFDFAVTAIAPHSGRVRWKTEIDANSWGLSYDYAHAISVDVHGDVAAAGELGSLFSVVKLDGATGTERWRATSDPRFGYGAATALAIDGRGDVVAAGNVAYQFLVRKYDGATGTLAWEQSLPAFFASAGNASTVSVTSGGDVIAAGSTPDEATYRGLAVVARLQGATGAVAWEHMLGEGSASAVVSPDGAVVVGGQLAANGADIVASLDPVSGDERWRATLRTAPAGEHLRLILVDSRGDPIACAENAGSVAVRKLDHATGTTVWERQLPAESLYWSPSITCAVAPDDDVAVARPLNPGSGRTLVSAVLDGATGEVRWERGLPAPLSPWQVTTDRTGNVFVAAEQAFDFAPFGIAGRFTTVGLGATSGSSRPQRAPRPKRQPR